LLTALSTSAAAADAGSESLRRSFAAAMAQGFAGEVLVGDLQRVHFHAVAGLAHRQPAQPHLAGQVWRWASVSKQVAATLVMREVDAGRVELDQPLSRYLPSFKGPSAERITVRHLLQHLSGLPNPDDTPAGPDGIPGFYAAGGPQALAFCAGAPRREPAVEFNYNNCDTLLVGELLAQVSGTPYARWLQQQLTTPLQLKTLRLADDRNPPRARAMAYDAKGAPVPQPLLSRFGAAGALEGSAPDLLAWDRALMSGRLVSPAGLRTLWAGEPKWGYVALGAWGFEAQLAGCAQPVQLVERRGDVGGIQVRNILAPALGMAVIVFTNLAEWEFGEVWQGKGFTHELLSAALCKPPR
jgi:D-alanyl-D-alanine carboxypeptidase